MIKTPSSSTNQPTAAMPQADSVCVRSQSFNASFMRVCQPGPVARKAFSTSGLYLIATCSFAGRRFGPLVLTFPVTTPPRFITAPSQSETLVRGLSGSIGVVVPVDALSMLSCLVNVGDRVQTVGTVLTKCATVSLGASNTFTGSEVQAPTSSGASSRPDFGGHGFIHFRAAFGRGAFVRKAGGMAEPMLLTPRPPVARSKAASGFQSRSGAIHMTTVTTLASRRAAPKLSQATTASHPTTSTSTSPCADLVQLHAEACNGLHAALRLLTSPEIEANKASFSRALARTLRASAALKRACDAVEA